MTEQVKYRKGFAVLAYLSMLPGQWIARGQLAGLLWPALAPPAALTNLRQVLNNLSRVLNEGHDGAVLRSDRERVALFADGRSVAVDLDWLDPRRIMELGLGPFEADDWLLTDFEPRQSELGGLLLEGLTLDVGTEFKAWLARTRQALETVRLQLLQRLCHAQERAGRHAAATISARAVAAADPLNEAAAGRLMRLLMCCGDRRGAQEAFDRLEHALMAQLGARPSRATRQLLDAPLAGVDSVIAAPSPSIPVIGPQAEMRWVTVVDLRFAELQGDLLPAIGLAQELMRGWGALVFPVIGRSLCACFGAEAAHERSAVRAMLAAQAVLAALGGRVPVSIGASAGRVVCSRRQDVPWDIVGDAPEAARLISPLAAPGNLLASEAVAQEVRDHFKVEALDGRWREGEQVLYRVDVAARPDAGHGRSQMDTGPMVGRSRELAVLHQRWLQAQCGQPQWVALRGEPGIGKTRLARGFAVQARSSAEGDAAPALVIVWPCALQHQHVSLAPLRSALARYCRIGGHESASEREALLRRGMARWLPAGELRRLAPQFATLARLLEPVRHGHDNVPVAGQHKQELFEAVFDLLDALALRQPVLLVVDDLHWSDEGTRELLSRYAGLFAAQHIMVLMTTRPEVGLPHAGTEPVWLDVPPLDHEAAEQLAAAQDAYHLLTPAQLREITAGCSGIPLFIEHQTRRVLEGSSQHVMPIGELLQAQLDRLGAFKPVAQVAAVLGQRVDTRLLARLLPQADVNAVLQVAESLHLMVGAGDAACMFRHALIRDAAYASLPQTAQRDWHGRIASLLQAEPGVLPGELAQHFDAAAQWPEAVVWWQRAGRAALAQEFAADAMRHFQRALELATTHGVLDAGALWSLRLAFGRAALVCQGYGSPHAYREFEAVFNEVDAIGAPTEADRQLRFVALSGVYWGAASQGRNDGIKVARQLEGLAAGPSQRLMACFALGNSLFWAGRFEEALRYQSEGAALSLQLPAAERLRYSGDDLAVLIRGFQAWNLWFLGDDEGACRVADEGIALAREGQKAHALCFVLSFAAAMRMSMRDVSGVRRHALEGLQLGTRFGFPLWQGTNGLFDLWAQAELGLVSDPGPVLRAAEQMRQAYQAGTATARWIVASALVRLGLHVDALAFIEQALADAEAFEDHYCRADLLLLSGRCLAAQGQAVLARQRRDAAEQLAQAQGARGLLAQLAALD
ncbi:AAA family ATPase [Roseateles sp. DAIF2]|uniref:AAA family ATPase n=1 Tax=Roseateles sp. DAIF2 TaxID=2714952 RepID=UPI0018A299CF|nr:AAA family ATPase [Roseateles sp. DAIF2]QPF76108.1 AAA family ATPase [Roseateles sp. DAIF2]